MVILSRFFKKAFLSLLLMGVKAIKCFNSERPKCPHFLLLSCKLTISWLKSPLSCDTLWNTTRKQPANTISALSSNLFPESYIRYTTTSSSQIITSFSYINILSLRKQIATVKNLNLKVFWKAYLKNWFLPFKLNSCVFSGHQTHIHVLEDLGSLVIAAYLSWYQFQY